MPTSLLTVNRRDPTPLHHQVRRGLLNHIRREDLRPGDRLPPEPELCGRFGVSRQTLRQAVEGLVQESVLIRHRPGGTFVGGGAVEGNLRSLRSIWEDLRRINLVPAARVLSARVVPCPRQVRALLEVAPGSTVLRLERLFTGNGNLIALDLSFFSLPQFAWLLDEDLSSSWYEILEGKRGISIEYAKQTLRATSASRRQAAHLRLSPGFPLLEIARQTYTHGGRLINYACSWFRGDRYHFSLVLPRHRPTLLTGGDSG